MTGHFVKDSMESKSYRQSDQAKEVDDAFDQGIEL